MKKYLTLKNIKKRVYSMFLTESEKRHSLVGPASLWKMKQEFQINFLKAQGLAPDYKLIDIGCGTLRGGIPIIDYLNEGNYVGLEVRESVLNEGKKELKANNLEHKNPQLIVFSNYNELSFNTSFDVLFAFSVLIHLEDSIVKDCFSFAGKNIADNGVFYANVNIEDQTDANWQGFPVVFRKMDFYKELAISNGLSMNSLGVLKDLGHDSKQELADKQVMLEFKKL